MSADRDASVANLAVERQRKRQAAAEAADATHHDLAHAWRDARALDGFQPVYANGAFYVPRADGLWEAMTPEEVQLEVARLFNGRKLCRKNADYKQLADHIAAMCADADYFDAAPAGVATVDGFHSIDRSGAVVTVPLALGHLQTFALPHAPDSEAESVLLDGVLSAAFAGDDAEAQIALWWQCAGAAIFGMMPRLQVVLLLLGRERSGKSLLQRVLEKAFPPCTVSAVSPASWGHEYHVAALAGKRLNVVGELDGDVPLPAAAFKNVTGQNLVAGRHPTHRPFSFRVLAAHVFAANVTPHTTDRSDALFRRFRVLRFSNTVPADQVNPNLCEQIIASEMPAFLAQAFRGAEQVALAGGLPTTKSHDAVLARWRLAANPLQQFLADDEWVELDPETRMHTTVDVYVAYRKWSAEAGFRNPFGRNHFLELLEATGATRGVAIKRIDTRTVVVGVRLLRI